jgi:alpha-L-rhamnosidase
VPLAWKLYTHFGDARPMEKAFDVILGHLRYLQGFVAGGVIRKELMGNPFHADWVPVDRGVETDCKPDQPMRELFNSCYLIYVWELFIKICSVLERPDEAGEAQRHIAALREGIHREFYKPAEGLYLMPEQAYQAMPLLAGVVPDGLRPAIRAKLLGLIEQRGWHMDTGLPGTTLLLDLLEQLGEHEVIGRIYNQEDYPGFGYMLAQGATAIWEQWNGYWSQIHSCFAGPASWRGWTLSRPATTPPGAALKAAGSGKRMACRGRLSSRRAARPPSACPWPILTAYPLTARPGQGSAR